MRVIVCGGRGYGEVPNTVPPLVGDALTEAINKADAERHTVFDILDGCSISEVAEGGAHGADRMARLWRKERGIDGKTYYADWISLGRAAGPKRNQFMLDDFKPDAVIAFPGGRGTTDMIAKAKAAGVRVIEVTP